MGGQNKKRILFYVSYLGLGGVATALIRLMRCLETQGFECRVMLPYAEVDQYAFLVVPQSYYAGAAWRRPVGNRFLRVGLKLFNVLTGWRFCFLFAQKIPHDVFVVYQVLGDEHWVRYSRKPTIGWIHGAMERMRGFRGVMHRMDRRRQLNCYAALLAVSDQMASLWWDYYAIRACPKTALNLIDVDELVRKGEEPQAEIRKSSRKQLLFLGRLFPEKGLMRLLEALVRLKEAESSEFDLWIIGIGREEKRARPFVSAHGMDDRVHFIGYRANPHPYLRAADLLVVPSYEEGFGLVIWEALLQHTSVMATQCGGCSQALKQGDWGLLVENSDEGVYDGILAFMNDPYCALPKCGFDRVESSIRRVNDDGIQGLRQLFCSVSAQ